MFNRSYITDYYRELQEHVRSEVLRESEEQIVGSSTDDLAQFYFDKYALAPLKEDEEREASFDLQDYLQDIPAHKRDSFYSQGGDLRDFPSQRVTIEVPLVHNKDWRTLAKLSGSQVFTDGREERLHWQEDLVSTAIETKGYGFEYDQEKIATEVNRLLGQIRDIIRFKNADILQANPILLTSIKNLIDERKQKIQQSKEKMLALTKAINIPLKKKDVVGAKAVRVSHSPLVQRIKPKPALPEEYVLDEGKVNDIVTLMDNQARSFEQTPRAFKTLGEEDLRDILLSNLNAVFEGGASGETFSKTGKTDIYLKIAKGNILICECKVWGGKKLYDATIDQLRGYLTWRHNYGIMITFVRIKDFTKALTEAKGLIQSHSSYLGSFKKINDTHFVSDNKVDDEQKIVKIHHLFYHLFSS